jgi:ribosomal protein S12
MSKVIVLNFILIKKAIMEHSLVLKMHCTTGDIPGYKFTILNMYYWIKKIKLELDKKTAILNYGNQFTSIALLPARYFNTIH